MAQGARPLLFVLHHHQPVGNLETVFAAAFSRCYEPVLAALERFSAIQVGLHYSGPLIEWLAKEQRPFLDRVRSLVERGQAEILGGGFYEPVLASIPENDALGQLEMMANSTERYFGVRPEGIWLAERVYEPDLPRLLAGAGVKYTLVDDHLLARSGHPPTGHYLTEKAGRPLSVFPIDQGLRYRIPFASPEEVVRYVVETPGRGCLAYGDDAEKFGLWPRTYESVHQKGWLHRLFGAFTEAQEQGLLRTVRPSQQLAAGPPQARVYLGDGAYEELTRWALPVEVAERLLALEGRLSEGGLLAEAKPFLAGGPWAGFLGKYPEANRLHKKMIDVSSRLESALEEAVKGRRLEGDLADRLGTAQRALYRGQCACAYWHGLFGGIYLGHLRSALYHSLLEAEVILDRLEQGEGDWISHEQRDYDLDGQEEISLANQHLGLWIEPHRGGAVVALDAKDRCLCLSDVLTRRPEPYHRLVHQAGPPAGPGSPADQQGWARAQEPHLKEALILDDRTRASFVDRFMALDVELPSVRRAGVPDRGDFASGPYQVVALGVHEDQDYACRLRMEREGLAGDQAVYVEKGYTLPLEGQTLSVRWIFENRSERPLALRFGSELNLNLFATADTAPFLVQGEDQHAFGSAGVIEDCRLFELQDPAEGLRISITWSRPGRLYRYPIETVSQSEDGLERTFQGTCFLPSWALSLLPGERTELGLSLAVEVLPR